LWDCFDLAMKRSETLAISKEEIGRTLGSFLEASGEAIGDFDFQMTERRQDPQKGGGEDSNFSYYERRERKFVYSQPIFQGFRALGALSGAGSLKKQKTNEWERAKQLLFMDVVDAFYEYLRLERDIEVIEGILNLFGERIKELKGWEDIGRTRTSEVATARSRLEIFRAELAKAKGDLAAAKNLLSFLIGIPVETRELADEDIDAFSNESIDPLQLSLERPDVEASRQAVKTVRGALIVAQSDLWPKVTLDGNLYEHREGPQSGISWDTLVTMKVPLGKGGTTVGEVRDALSQWREAKLTYSLTQRTAEREITDAFDRWKSSSERYGSLEKAVAAAQENFNLQKDEYEHHLVSNLDVLEAMQVLFETRRDANEAFYDMKKNYWQLEVAKGRCCAEA
ncbi:MAG: TolC family protein, partial [Candidatus Omnitrophica bacterium]|nr:TolC family protein [Candidatus Omnitrophota bacterium]